MQVLQGSAQGTHLAFKAKRDDPQFEIHKVPFRYKLLLHAVQLFIVILQVRQLALQLVQIFELFIVIFTGQVVMQELLYKT
jgi:hypothetical protein